MRPAPVRAENQLANLDFVVQSHLMETNWAAEHLQTIRTLMERSAVYRRALAPVMIFCGVVGIVGGGAGWILRVESPRMFVLFWAGVAAFALSGSFLLVRRQALKDSEPFWSPPTRRIAQAMLPALFVGCAAGALLGLPQGSSEIPVWWLPSIWMGLYGCAIHAAGFFMPRGMKVFGWSYILLGGTIFWRFNFLPDVPPMIRAHLLMGAAFGGLHLAYGIYLYFTEKRGNES